MRSDYHLHTNFSGDSDANMEEMIEKGIDLGLNIMCFTEHMDLDYPENGIDFEVKTDDYLAKFMELKEKYSKKIKLLFGIELGLQTHLSNTYQKYVASYPFDFVIGSSHLVGREDPYDPQCFAGKEEKEVYGSYFQSIYDNLSVFSNFDVYGHLDYVVRYGPNKNRSYYYEDYQDIIEEILKKLIAKNLGLECNTAGFKYGLGHPHPTEEILCRYRELGGEIISLGSDAHEPQHLAYALDKGKDILRNCGFKYYTIFEKRCPEFVKL